MTDQDVLPGFEGWTVPLGYAPRQLARCNGCMAMILWARTPSGRYAPLDPSGLNHFATCPKADLFRRRVGAARKGPAR